MPEALATAIWEAGEDRRSVFMVVNNRLEGNAPGTIDGAMDEA